METIGLCALALFFAGLSIMVEVAPILIIVALAMLLTKVIAQIFTRS